MYYTIISEPLAILHNNKVYSIISSLCLPGLLQYCNLALEKKKVMAIQAKAMAQQCYNVVIYCTVYIQKEKTTKHLLQEKQNICIHTLKINRHILILKERKSKKKYKLRYGNN